MLSPLRRPETSMRRARTPRLDRRACGDLQCRLACGICAASSGCGFPWVQWLPAAVLAQTCQLLVCAVLAVPRGASCWQGCSGQLAAWLVAWLAVRAQMCQLCDTRCASCVCSIWQCHVAAAGLLVSRPRWPRPACHNAVTGLL